MRNILALLFVMLSVSACDETSLSCKDGIKTSRETLLTPGTVIVFFKDSLTTPNGETFEYCFAGTALFSCKEYEQIKKAIAE
ncbi:MAG: hypothetical protein NTX72_01125 [Candidatus Uhrbacteria bacterium]|nr:hypothetical protein [Candidatus Uhrbacteria bacterium]